MKKIKILSKTGLMCLWVLLLVYETTQAQSPYTGIWEGNFMDQFKTVILLDQLEGNGFAGKIIMFSGENRIQDLLKGRDTYKSKVDELLKEKQALNN